MLRLEVTKKCSTDKKCQCRGVIVNYCQIDFLARPPYTQKETKPGRFPGTQDIVFNPGHGAYISVATINPQKTG